MLLKSMNRLMACAVPVKWDSLIARIELDGQPASLKLITEDKESVLRCQNIDVA